MAWTDPNTYIAGAILTAAQMNAMQANALAGGPIYATEAARTTAIPSPFEGQRAYITGSTVATATGAITAIPTGIQTIYNGAAWVCVTSVGASSNTTGTTISGSYVTTLTGDGTAISATLPTGTTALITLSTNATSANVIAIRQTFSVSGATTLAAADNNGSTVSVPNAGNAIQLNRTLIITGLTAGTNTFTMNYLSVGGSNTASFSQRSMFVQGIA